MNELKISEKIQVEPGVIRFNEFEVLKGQAQQIADYILTVDGSDENAKQAKQVLAAARKAVKALSDKRIEIKKSYLAPYDEFENRIKEITGVIDAAHKKLNEQVKAAEKIEKDQKLTMIETAFEFIVPDEIQKIGGFDWFMKPEYLNKTVSLSRIEKELRETSNRIQGEIETIRNMDDSAEIMTEYIRSGGYLGGALESVQARKKVTERAKIVIKENNMIEIPIERVEPQEEPEFTFTIKGQFNADMVKKLLDRYDIEYTVTGE